jgi:hypothetical protein
MVTTNSAQEAIPTHRFGEEFQDSLCAIIVADTNAGNQLGFSMDKAVDNDLEADETESKKGEKESRLTEEEDADHAGHCGAKVGWHWQPGMVSGG